MNRVQSHNFRFARSKVAQMTKPERSTYLMLIRMGPLGVFCAAILAMNTEAAI